MARSAWLEMLKIDPLPALLGWKDAALTYFIRRDLLEEPVGAIQSLWGLPEATQLVEKQQPDGSWKYPGKPAVSIAGQNYSLLETYRSLRLLVEMYGFNASHPALQKAAGYVFSCQTAEGDIRGILENQYMPYYHGAILELLIKAGYAGDRRVCTGLDWLLAMRQEDGGWIVPAQGVPSRNRTAEFWSSAPVLPDRSKPHAHLATGMVLRAFAAHPDYCWRPEVIAAGRCLKGRLFRADAYTDRKAPAYWVKFQFPFWWTSLVTAVDTLTRLGCRGEDAEVKAGIDWFATHQQADGLWPTGYDSGQKSEQNRRWVGLAICRNLFLGHFGWLLQPK